MRMKANASTNVWGHYNDFNNKPTILQQVESNWLQYICTYFIRIKQKFAFLFLYYHKCPVCIRVYFVRNFSTKCPSNAFTVRQCSCPAVSGFPFRCSDSSLIYSSHRSEKYNIVTCGNVGIFSIYQESHLVELHLYTREKETGLYLWWKCFLYRSETVNSNTVNSKYHLIRSFFEIFADSYHFVFKMNG